MINRELIRTKVVQLVYAYYQNGSFDLAKSEKELDFSLSKAYHLYHYLLELIVAISREECMRYDLALQRAIREGRQLPPSKFANNRFAAQLEENLQLREYVEKRRIDWSEDLEYVRKICNMIEKLDAYNEYLYSPADSYEADREVWRLLYKLVILNNEDLDTLFESKSLYWNDDKDVVDSFVLKTIKRFQADSTPDQPLLPEYQNEQDRDYAINLFRGAIMHGEEYQEIMSEISENWDLERLAYMDIVIMQTAMSEMMNFPTIPLSVTINEFVEIAKSYSTPLSGGYVNGMLDAIADYLIAHAMILKQK